MLLANYTVPITNGMRLRHDAQARFTVTSDKAVLEDRLTGVEALGGAVAVAGYVYNRLTLSGGVSWWNPATGAPISRPKVTMRAQPQDVLHGDEECGCARCAR